MTDAEKTKLIADVLTDVSRDQYDRFLNKEQFNEHSRDVLMRAETHDLLERDLIDLVSTTNGKECEIVEVKGAKTTHRVLVLGNHVRYAEWRKLYDSL